MKQVNWGIIGLGNIALKFAEAFKNLNNSKLLGISSKDMNKIEQYKKEFKINKDYCFDNYEELLKCNDIDIVYIALPNSLHYEIIIKAIENKKKILVEKPVTSSFAQIKDIKDKHYNKNLFFAEAFMYRYHPQILNVIDLINKRAIGDLVSMESFFGKDILTKKNFFGFKRRKKLNKESRLFNKELGGGAILDLGCYPVSMSTLMASLISKVNYDKIKMLNIKKEIGSTNVDIDSYAEINFENNFRSKMGASFTKNLGQKSKIVGKKGTIEIESTWHAKPSKITVSNQKKQVIQNNYKENILSYEIELISKYILDGKNKPDFPGLTIDDTLGNMKIIDMWLN